MVTFLNPRALLPTQGTAWATASVPVARLQGPQGDSHQACSQVSRQDRVPSVSCPCIVLGWAPAYETVMRGPAPEAGPSKVSAAWNTAATTAQNRGLGG